MLEISYPPANGASLGSFLCSKICYHPFSLRSQGDKLSKLKVLVHTLHVCYVTELYICRALSTDIMSMIKKHKNSISSVTKLLIKITPPTKIV